MLLPGREESEGQACITHIYTAASLLLSTDFYTGRNIKQPQPPQVWLSTRREIPRNFVLNTKTFFE